MNQMSPERPDEEQLNEPDASEYLTEEPAGDLQDSSLKEV